MIRVELPGHLRTLAAVSGEVSVEVAAPVTQRAVLDALELKYPMLRGTIRDPFTTQSDGRFCGSLRVRKTFRFKGWMLCCLTPCWMGVRPFWWWEPWLVVERSASSWLVLHLRDTAFEAGL